MYFNAHQHSSKEDCDTRNPASQYVYICFMMHGRLYHRDCTGTLYHAGAIYDTISYFYMRSKSDEASLISSNAASIGEHKTWTQSEFCSWQNSVRRQEPQKMYI